MHMLAERNWLGYDMRVCELWPEFGTNGKDQITIRQVLSHTAGLLFRNAHGVSRIHVWLDRW